MRRTVNIWWVIAVVACVTAAFFWYSNELTETVAQLEAAVETGNVRLAALEAENARLNATLKEAGTDAFVEDQARNEYGYMMPDEIRFVISGSDYQNESVTETEVPSP